jgi:hypothetical protein
MAVDHFDVTVPITDMEFETLTRMVIDGTTVEVLPAAQRLFANRLKVPHSYLQRCPYDLQAENLNYWLRQQTRESLFCRFDGRKLRAVFTDRYRCIDNAQIMERLEECAFGADAELHMNLSPDLMVLKVPDYRRTFAFEGDRITPGIAICNSEVGLVAFSIEAYFYRLVCSNGMISATQVTSKFRHVSLRGLEKLDEVIQLVAAESRHNQDKLIHSRNVLVDDALATISSYNKQFQLGKSESEVVERAWFKEQGKTMFHVINAYTRAAQEESLTAGAAHRLETVAGRILALLG